jgi:hypothetical protein
MEKQLRVFWTGLTRLTRGGRRQNGITEFSKLTEFFNRKT